MAYAERPAHRALRARAAIPLRAQIAMRTRHITKLVSSVLGLIALVCLWVCFAPAAVGGSTSYVVTEGVSMQPRFHSGDLVLVRNQSSYHVGQIVAYHSNVFHTVVLHRIIARDGSRYVFKGDNNNFVDFEHPAQSQLIGALWLHIPGAGTRLQSLHSPALVGILVAVGTLLFAGAAFTQHRRRRRRERRVTENAQRPPRLSPQYPAGPVVGILAVGLLALLPFLALALLAFTRPTAALLPADIPYRQSGALSYAADATPGPAYSGNRAVTGDPLFTHVLSTVDLRFDYRFHTAARHSLSGKAALYASVSSTSGWQATLPLGSPSYFRGDRAVVNASLDLHSLLALMQRVEATTAVGGSYTLTIVPHVSVAGHVAAAALRTTFTPRIQFSINQREVQPLVAGGSPLAGGRSASPASQFLPSTTASATGKVYQPLFISFKFTRLSVATARWIALGGIAVISCAVLLILAFARPRRRDESGAIRARYGRSIVPVARVWQEPGVAVIDVSDMDALVRIAERYDRSILQETTDEGDAFWVTDESGQFRYALGAPAYAVADAPAYAVADAAAHTSEYPAVDAADYTEGDTSEYPAMPVAEYAASDAAAYTDGNASEYPAAYTNGNGNTNGDAADYTAAEEAVGQPPLEDLVGAVYADELALGGAISASEAQPAAEMPSGDPASQNGWAGFDETDLSTQETNEWRAAWDSTNVNQARGRAAFAGVTGPERS